MKVVSENRMLTEREIERLAESQAEREAFVKSTIVFVVIWIVGFLTLPLVPEVHYRLAGFIVSLRIIYFIASFFAAFFAGLITRWIIKDNAYEKYYAQYKEQLRQPIPPKEQLL